MTQFIPLYLGQKVVAHAIVDDKDYEWLMQWRWHYNRILNRAFRYVGRSSAYMHREIIATPKGIQTDHINRDRLDNRRANLRFATCGQNLCNRGKSPKPTSSRFIGVTWDKNRGKWQTHVSVANKPIWVGRFTDEEEAARARDAAAKQYYGEFAQLNFPDEVNHDTTS